MGKRNNLLLIVFFVALSRVASNKTTLYVGALLELSNHWYQSYVNFFVTIIEHVFEEVENRTDILADYSLRLITKDTQGISGLASKKFFELMTEGPPIVAIIGPSLSSEVTVVGQIAPFYNVIELSYIALTSSTLAQELFPTLFMVNQIMDDLNPLRIKMMEYFNWKRVGTLFLQNDIFVSHMNMFHDLLQTQNMTLLTSAVGSNGNSDAKMLISRLVQYDVRIIMAAFSGSISPKFFCEAYRQGIYGSKYVWILNGPVFDISRVSEDFSQFDCTYQQFLEVTNGIFTLDYDMIDSENSTTIAGLTPAELTRIFKDRISITEYKLSSYYGYVYDAAWSLVAGLNNSLHHLDESGLKEYKNSPFYLEAISKGMHEVNFAGISGPVSFDATGRRAGVTYIEQIFNTTSRTRVAMYNHKTGYLKWFVEPTSLWPGNVVPEDMFTYENIMVAPNIPSLVLIMVTNTVCCATATGFLGFNIHYRRNSNIKLSSPMINNIIIGGSILMFLCVFLTAFDYGNFLSEAFEETICMLRVWVMCLGFTCLFGALFSKTLRVHILFRNNQLKKKAIKDFHLFGIVIFLLLIDCMILVPWTVLHGLLKERIVEKTKDLSNQNNIIAEVYTYCHHQYEGYWFISMYIYKGLLLAFGTFLAWETRHVTVPALNDSKYIGFCIYNVVIVCFFGVPLTHVLPTRQITMNFVLLSTLIMFCTTMCLCILFIPKIKIRHQVNGKFLNPSLNAKPSSRSTSEQKASGSSCKNNYSEDSTDVKAKEVESNSVQATESIRNEIDLRRMKIEADTIAIERLKRLMLEAVKEEYAQNEEQNTDSIQIEPGTYNFNITRFRQRAEYSV